MEGTIDDSFLRIDAAEETHGVLERVHDRLSQSCHFTRHWREIVCQFEDGVLTLRGSVPSFYLKQVLQSTLMNLQGIHRINNQVDVVSAAGLSSVRSRD